MSLILSKKKQPSVKLDAVGFDMEDSLQEYIQNNPDVIPLYDIKEDIKLCILAREFSTTSGPIDAIGIDRDGGLYIIETKLYKNSDKRKVVAQVLDYAASLWTQYQSTDAFMSDLSNHIQKQEGVSLNEKITDFFSLDEENCRLLTEDIKTGLASGNYKLVVLMDALHQQLKDLIIYINKNSEFDIYAVQLEYYKHDDLEITIPKLFGAEIKKDIAQSVKHFPSDDDFINAYGDIGFGNQSQAIIDLFNKIQSESPYKNVTARKTPKFLNFYIHINDTKISMSIHADPQGIRSTIDFWFDGHFWNEQNYKKMKSICEELMPGIEVIDPMDNRYGKFTQWPIDKVSTENLTQYMKKVVEDFSA